MATETKKKKIKKNIPVGIAHVNATFNNTIITSLDLSETNITTINSFVFKFDENPMGGLTSKKIFFQKRVFFHKTGILPSIFNFSNTKMLIF